jgi:AcrR family transcriptional regulator
VGVTVPTHRRLPRGRHALPPDEVARTQRARLFLAMAQAMSRQGFAATSVGDVLKLAGVSRQTFYQLFSSKLDCFMATFDAATELLEARLNEAVEGAGTPLERFERAIDAYVTSLASEPGYARLFLVEAHAAGPEAIRRRLQFQYRLADRIAGLFDSGSEDARFACRTIAAAVASMVVGPLLDDDPEALRRLADDMTRHVRRLSEAGVL